MVPLNAKRKAELEHPVRRAIYDFLKGYDKPASLGEIAEGVELTDLAVAFYQLNCLVRVELVEKVFGLERYQLTEAAK